MDFDKSRVYTALNADEVKTGSKVIVADTLSDLKMYVISNANSVTLTGIRPTTFTSRFETSGVDTSNLAYLVLAPEEQKLKWTDLKLLDHIRHKDGTEEGIVIHIKNAGTMHICCARWISDEELAEWEKVEWEKVE